jgi:hypothetical protein
MDHGRRNRWIIIAAALGCPGGDGMRGTYPHGGLQYELVPGAKKSKSLSEWKVYAPFDIATTLDFASDFL